MRDARSSGPQWVCEAFINSELRFNNPNASNYCGCGESFSIDAGIH